MERSVRECGTDYGRRWFAVLDCGHVWRMFGWRAPGSKQNCARCRREAAHA